MSFDTIVMWIMASGALLGAVDKVLCYGKWAATQAVAMDAMDAMRELLGGGPLTVGVEGDYASMNFLDRLKTKLQVKGYVDIAQDAVDLRLIKDPHEIKMCRISGELVDLGVTRAIEALEGGASEAQAATEGQYAMRNRWHEKYQQYEVSGFSNSPTSTPSWSGACPTSGSTTAVTAPPATSPCPAT